MYFCLKKRPYFARIFTKMSPYEEFSHTDDIVLIMWIAGLARQYLNLLLSHTFQTCTLFHQGNARNHCGGRGHWAQAEARVCCQLEAFWMGSGGSLSSFEAIISFHFFIRSLFWCSPPTKLDRAWPASGWLVGREIHFCLLSKMQSFPWWSTGDSLSDHLILWVPWRWLKPCFLSAQKSMTWPPCLSTTLKTMRCLVVMCTMSGCQVWGSILKTGDSIGKSLFCLKAIFQALSNFIFPTLRCAAMLAYGRKIVILPFRREANAPAEDPDR